MSAIFGLFVRDPALASPDLWLGKRPARARIEVRHVDGAALLCGDRDAGPSAERPFALVSQGAIHNRAELAHALGFGATPPSDQLLFERAFVRWGAQACEHIHGDWSFAAWDPVSRTLTLGRDHLGNTSLYYYADAGIFAFATSLHDLLALGLAPIAMDELYLAQTLVSWPAFAGERTIHAPMLRLPPAHHLSVTPSRLDKAVYWQLERVELVALPKREDYVERFRTLFDQAVRERLPDDGRVAATLSAGLDSGSVSATAAMLLRDRGERLRAYTSVPLADTACYTGRAMGDEYPLAKLTADHAGTIDLQTIAAAAVSPIATIREMLDITLHPEHAAGNFFWLLDLYRTAARDGFGVVLTGQMGNAGASWTGGANAWPLRRQIAREGLGGMAKRRIRQAMPAAMERLYRRVREDRADFSGSAIAEDFAARLDLHRLRNRDRLDAPYPSAHRERMGLLRPGASVAGAVHAQMAAAAGITVSDPTADARLLEFCLSVPDAIFVDAERGTNRWLIRAAMRDRLPDAVRLNRTHGQQAADLVPRLRAHADEVEAALDEIAQGPARDYVDAAKLRAVWAVAQREDTPGAFHRSVTMLTRGIMAGLFVNGLTKATGVMRA